MTLKLVRQADPSRFAIAESKRKIWDSIEPAGTKVEDLMVPAYWKLIVARYGLDRIAGISPWDRLECREETGAWYAEFVIRHASHDGLELHPLKGVLLQDVGPQGASPRVTTGLSVRYAGPHLLWVVERDGKAIRTGFRTEAEARAWMTDNAKTTGYTPEAA